MSIPLLVYIENGFRVSSTATIAYNQNKLRYGEIKDES